MAPETEILSLESMGATMTNPVSQFGHTDPDSTTGNYHAPKKKIF